MRGEQNPPTENQESEEQPNVAPVEQDQNENDQNNNNAPDEAEAEAEEEEPKQAEPIPEEAAAPNEETNEEPP